MVRRPTHRWPLLPSVLSRAGGGGGATAAAGHAAAASASTPRLRHRPIAWRLRPSFPSRVGGGGDGAGLIASSPPPRSPSHPFHSPVLLSLYLSLLSQSASSECGGDAAPASDLEQTIMLPGACEHVAQRRRSRGQAQAKVQALASMHAPAPALRVSHCENSSNAQQMLSLSHSVKSPAVRRRYACACEDWERCRGWRKPHRAPARSAW